jgi:hypothetical protein
MGESLFHRGGLRQARVLVPVMSLSPGKSEAGLLNRLLTPPGIEPPQE